MDNKNSKLQKESEEYLAFLKKFEVKKTTDDCFTPPAVYAAVVGWVLSRLPELEGRPIVRPFYPGGDYESYEYPKNCVVIDNPPFSLQSKIVRFYINKNVDFFLFAPGTTQFVKGADVTYIITDADIEYDNGAKVNTSFTTNLFPGIRIMSAPDLMDSIKIHQKVSKVSKKKKRISYPRNFTKIPLLTKYTAAGLEFIFRSTELEPVRKLDNFGSVFGSGWIISSSAQKRLDELERKRLDELERKRLDELERKRLDELERKRLDELERIELSERELEIVRLLDI